MLPDNIELEGVDIGKAQNELFRAWNSGQKPKTQVVKVIAVGYTGEGQLAVSEIYAKAIPRTESWRFRGSISCKAGKLDCEGMVNVHGNASCEKHSQG